MCKVIRFHFCTQLNPGIIHLKSKYLIQMKIHIWYLLFLMWLPGKSFGNVIFPQAYISELAFDSLGGWILELNFYEHPDSLHIDSIILETYAGDSKIANYTAFQPHENSIYLAVITQDSLVVPLQISRDSDLITISSYHGHTGYDVQLHIGTYLWGIPEGHSAVVIPHCTECGGFINPWTCYMLDNSPTIGEINDLEGTRATVQGFVHNMNNIPITDSLLYAYAGFIETDENGYYYAEDVLSRYYSFDTVTLWGTIYTFDYEPVSLMVFPDSLYVQDLVLLSVHNWLSVPGVDQDVVKIAFYPNPFNSNTRLYISIQNEMVFTQASLEFYDNKGRKVFSSTIDEYQSVINLSAEELNLNKGIFYAVLYLDGKVRVKTQVLVKL